MARRPKIAVVFCTALAMLLLANVASAALVGHWKLDEISGKLVTDSSGSSKHGVLAGNPIWRPAGGKVSGALEFDGLDDYVSAPFVLNPADGPFSAFAWVKTTAAAEAIISQMNGSGLGRTWLGTDPSLGALVTGLTDGGRFTAPLQSNLVVADGAWHHIGVTWDGSRRRLYLDGAEAAADTEALGQLYSCNGGMYFGASKTLGQSEFLSGLADDIRVYDSAVDASHIAELASSGETQSNDTVSVVALVPKLLYAGGTATVSLTAVNVTDRSPAVVPVAMSFGPNAADSSQLFEGTTDMQGRLTGRLDIPDVTPGTYTLQIGVDGVENPMMAQVQVKCMPVILIETDKPIYKPGQTIHGRVLVLSNDLRPTVPAEASVEITDGKGVKIFRKELTANAFGVAPFELDLANELNFGTWKITAKSGSASGAVDVRVEKYVLPRFDVELLTERDYFLVDEQISGTVKAAYFFGKSVEGTVTVRASRYIGLWEEYASYTATLSDGSAEFMLPAVGYVSGTPGAGGAGSVQLEVVVTDTSDHAEETVKLLKIVDSSIQCQLIALSRSITPGQPFEVLLVTETPDGQPASGAATVTCHCFDMQYRTISEQSESFKQVDGSAIASFTAPEDTAWAELRASVQGQDGSGEVYLTVYAAYSPTDSFLHLRRASDEPIRVGDTVTIDVFRTHEETIYYDVFATGHTVWSDATTGSEIVFQATQQMVPAAKVVAYIINPNNEISADTLPLEVTIEDAAGLRVEFDAEQALPGEPVQVSVEAETEAMVGLAIVDESVYALNEGRLNMQEVFNELERRFMEPQVEIHEHPSTYGAYEVFTQAGLQVLASSAVDVPQGQRVGWDWWWLIDGIPINAGGWVPAPEAPFADKTEPEVPLAEVSYIRQYFPETWLWMPDLLTQPDGTATVDLTTPDSITTWRLHAVSTSSEGLGITESSLLVFQEFFGEPDLPYAVTRGEQFPVRIQIFNYLDEPQAVQVELAEADWFQLLDDGIKQVSVDAGSVGLVSFLIEPTKLGRSMLEVTLRSPVRADAVRKELLVEAEGTRREVVTNGVIEAGQTVALDADMPSYRVEGSEKLLLSITPSLVAQSINGVDDLLNMPFGCGEQNMIFFAPDVEVLRYLDATGQLTPEVRAKAEHFINVGYQRELTYRHQDGSFSAFGESDKTGSLWLTAFVLDCFSAARDIQTIDETVLAEAAAWIEGHQLPDGSWEPVGFICHSEMVGGMEGTYALTAFVTIALADYGAATPQVLEKATEYLTTNLSAVRDDAYALAVAALAFARVNNRPAVDMAIERLLDIAIRDDDGIHWEPYPVETTAYVALAMIETGKPQASEAVKWLALQRNGLGGFSSTQDTVMALKALMMAARNQSRNVDLIITAKVPGKGTLAEFRVDSSNFDVLQIAELPAVADIELSATGSGEARFQLVCIFNVYLVDDCIRKDMTLEVIYDADNVEIDDIVNVTATVRYFGRPGSSGMMIVDVGVPTGFVPVQPSLEALIEAEKISRFEIAGRKIILYVDGLSSGEQRTFTLQVKARFPVRAVVPDSKAYLYYQPQIRAECAGTKITAGFVTCTVDFDYLAQFAGQWLQTGVTSATDLDDNGSVDFRDFSLLANHWLDACPQP